MIKKALCIGNGAYPGTRLRSPANDAEAISTRLQALGFSCQLLKDAEDKDMDIAIKSFGAELMDSDVGLFFFAGHGMQIGGENFLTAVDTDFEDETSARHSSQHLNRIIEVLEKGENSTSIVILDACRNNPFAVRSRGNNSHGLAPVYAPRGTIIAFATSPGQAALEGAGENGFFTSALLQHIDTQNITIEDLLKRVRNTLSASTSGKQTSWEHTSLMGDFFFHTSILTGEFIAEYSKEARADVLFDTSGALSIYDIIRRLKSHDWHVQNPAIRAIATTALDGSGKEALFVLGRNLYQSACGGSAAAITVLSGISSFLSGFEYEAAFHILNGALYEIYFDSRGRLRKDKKVQKAEMLFSLEDEEDYARSFEFIRQALLPHQKHLFYLPGICRDVIIDVVLKPVLSDTAAVVGIMIEGQDTFYADDGVTLVSGTSNLDLRSRNIRQFEREVLDQMVLPEKRFQISYTHNLPEECSLLLPYEFSIKRLSG
jgi:hypothetical protein